MKSSHSFGMIPGLHVERKKQEGGNRKCQDVHPSACSWPETLLMNKTGKLNACSSPCLLELLAFQCRHFHIELIRQHRGLRGTRSEPLEAFSYRLSLLPRTPCQLCQTTPTTEPYSSVTS